MSLFLFNLLDFSVRCACTSKSKFKDTLAALGTESGKVS